MIKRFVKKPIPIEAVKCVKENEKEIKELLDCGATDWSLVYDDNFDIIGYMIHSWEGIEPIYYDCSKNKNSNNKPYWIILRLKNEVYPCVADDNDDAPLGYKEDKLDKDHK